MAAPTPVSSLVHSSTLVTAGVYLIIRLKYLFFDLMGLWLIFFLGTVTMLIARLAAVFESDLKKIVALSTLSQLGIIVCLLGLGLTTLRFIHLLAHAYFKALMFLGTGNMIHASNRGQDIRRIGANSDRFRCTKRMVLVSNVRLAGLPFISAFFSKEYFLESLCRVNCPWVLFTMFYLSVSLTLIYRVRFLSLFYAGIKKSNSVNSTLDSDSFVILPIIILLIPAICIGK